ncbi:MAG: amino acid adenylation domain-containing protein [Lachnospiraceae bacterium]|nr:amino acid adenylation domain-containing protein [Lachnospiraceae bacterium]
MNTVLDYIDAIEMAYPDKYAYVDDRLSYSFSDVKRIAKAIGTFLTKRFGMYNPVVVYMEKRAYNIPAFFGAVYAGMFYVPIDKQMPNDRIRIIFDCLNPSVIICDEFTEKNARENFNDIPIYSFSEVIAESIEDDILNRIRLKMKSTDLLYVLFTSGSTGVPKGVTIPHLAVIDFVEWISNKYTMSENTKLCNQAPFYFDASVPDIYIPLKTGATLYIPPKSYYTFPKKIMNYLNECNINTLIWVPSALCNVVNCKAFDVTVPKYIELVIFCGEVMPCKHLNVWKKYIPNALYVNMYGPTEATYACMYYDINRIFSDEEKLPLGKACENSTIILLDENDKLVKTGEIGEICVMGQCLSQGYYNAWEKTRESFVQCPLNSLWMESMYRTGDLAYLDECGEYVFVGRKDFQIKRLGHRIELGEIETAILSIPEVLSACCMYDQQSNDILAVYVGNIDIREVDKRIKSRLSSYMLPTKYEKIEEMPMNMNGKIDRVLLKKVYVQN